MSVVVAAPVANRPWAMDDWFACLANQTVKPDVVHLLHGGLRGDSTWRAAQRAAGNTGLRLSLMHDQLGRTHQRHDPERFRTLANLRNMLKSWVRATCDADTYLSLDTDIMLEDPTTIARLVHRLDSCDVVAPVTWLHPLGKGSWCNNAAWWSPDSELGDTERRWVRAEQTHIEQAIEEKVCIGIDIPFAVWAARMTAIKDAHYRWHESGEDLGFGQDLDRLDLTVWWDPSIECRHVWQESDL